MTVQALCECMHVHAYTVCAYSELYNVVMREQ